MVISVDPVINMPIHYTFNILSGKYRTQYSTLTGRRNVKSTT